MFYRLFRGTSGIDIDLRRVDIDQCPQRQVAGGVALPLNIFAGTDKCKARTTEVNVEYFSYTFCCFPLHTFKKFPWFGYMKVKNALKYSRESFNVWQLAEFPENFIDLSKYQIIKQPLSIEASIKLSRHLINID